VAGEGAFKAGGKSIVMKLLPAAEVFRHAGFLFLWRGKRGERC